MTTQPVEPIADRTMSAPLLDCADRCDACGSQAYVIIMFEKNELLMCGHHFHAHEAALLKADTVIIDERYRLQEAVKDDGHYIEGKPSR